MSGDSILILIFVLMAIGCYFIPTIFAMNRNHRNRGSIMVLNLFFGWSFIGWVVALMWSMSGNVESN